METTVLSGATLDQEVFDDWDILDIPIPEIPYVDPVTREAADLFLECDRIDAMSHSQVRDTALLALLARIEVFETTVPEPVKNTVLNTALKMV